MRTILLAVAVLVLAVLLFFLPSSFPWLLAGFCFLGLGLSPESCSVEL